MDSNTPETEYRSRKDRRGRRGIALLILILAVLAAFTAAGIYLIKKYSVPDYERKVRGIIYAMDRGVALDHDEHYTYQAIFARWFNKESDEEYDRFTKDENGSFHEDAKEALRRYHDSLDSEQNRAKMQKNLEEVRRAVKQLGTPPEEYAEVYEKLGLCLDAYEKITELCSDLSNGLELFKYMSLLGQYQKNADQVKLMTGMISEDETVYYNIFDPDNTKSESTADTAAESTAETTGESAAETPAETTAETPAETTAETPEETSAEIPASMPDTIPAGEYPTGTDSGAYRILSSMDWADTVWQDADDTCRLRIINVDERGAELYWHRTQPRDREAYIRPDYVTQSLTTVAFYRGDRMTGHFSDYNYSAGTYELTVSEGSLHIRTFTGDQAKYDRSRFPDLDLELTARPSGGEAYYQAEQLRPYVGTLETKYYGTCSYFLENIEGITDVSGAFYQIFDTDSEYLTEEYFADLRDQVDADMYAELLQICRNEIYARHGYRFQNPDWYNLFMRFSWYYPDYSPENFDGSSFNEYETANLRLLEKLESAIGQ